MALKIWLNGTMNKLTRHNMVTFVSGNKKKLKKGITFVNGEKKILWQTGEFVFNSWLISALQYPNTVNVGSKICGLEGSENKVIYQVNEYVCRANVENLSSPFHDGANTYGTITYRKPDTDAGMTYFESNVISFENSRRTKRLTQNKIKIQRSDFSITAEQEYTNTYSAGSSIVVPSNFQYYESNLINAGDTYGECQVVAESGNYKVYKNRAANSASLVATINSNGYSSNVKPTVWCYALYNSRYLLFGAQYIATEGGNMVYSLKKVDLSNGNVSTILNNKTLPINAILIDGNYIIVTTENKMIKLDIDGTVIDTYESSNDMTTLIGRCGSYYYLTTTTVLDNANKLNIEIVEDNDFSTGEVKPQEVNMVQTIGYPYISDTGYLCFATKSYTTTSLPTGATGGIGRQGSINQLNSTSGTYTAYSNVELRICRIQCY